jgi:hypothetical protein
VLSTARHREYNMKQICKYTKVAASTVDNVLVAKAEEEEEMANRR